MLRLLLLCLGLMVPGQLAAQDPAPAAPVSPILTIEQDRLFAESDYGLRVRVELDEGLAALATENRAIEEALVQEEQDLADRRPTVDPDEFRALADAFDQKVVRIRTEQEAKERALSARADQERQRFFQLVLPVLAEIVRERQALAILEARAIFLSSNQIDITDEAIAGANALFGDGTEAPPETPEE